MVLVTQGVSGQKRAFWVSKSKERERERGRGRGRGRERERETEREKVCLGWQKWQPLVAHTRKRGQTPPPPKQMFLKTGSGESTSFLSLVLGILPEKLATIAKHFSLYFTWDVFPTLYTYFTLNHQTQLTSHFSSQRSVNVIKIKSMTSKSLLYVLHQNRQLWATSTSLGSFPYSDTASITIIGLIFDTPIETFLAKNCFIFIDL